MTYNRLVGGLLVAVVMLTVVSAVGANPYQPIPVSHGKFGAKLGIVYSSHFRVDGVSENADMGVSFGILFDIPVHRRGMTGLSLDLHDIHIYNKRKKMLDISIPVKYRFIFTERRWEMRAMASAGFGYMTLVDKIERTTYLTLKSGLEAVFHSNTRYSLVVDGLVFVAPTGGNKEHDVTYGPTFLLRVGLIY